MLGYCHLDTQEQTTVKYKKLLINENAAENIVCEMAAILSQGRWVDQQQTPHLILSGKLWDVFVHLQCNNRTLVYAAQYSPW